MKNRTEIGISEQVLNWINGKTTTNQVAEKFNLSKNAAHLLCNTLSKNGLLTKIVGNKYGDCDWEKSQTETTGYTPSNESDDLNPQFLFHTTFSELLCAIVNGEIDPKELAAKELKNRGLDNNGFWVGFGN